MSTEPGETAESPAATPKQKDLGVLPAAAFPHSPYFRVQVFLSARVGTV